MRIAFDLDGVLADLHTAFTQTALALYPELDRSVIDAPEVGASPPVDEEGEDTETEAPGLGVAAVAVDRRQTDAIWKRLRATEPPDRPDFWVDGAGSAPPPRPIS